MALAHDASSPARFSGTPADNVNITSASFTPPAGSILVVTVQMNSLGQAVLASVTDSQGLTWTENVRRNLTDGGEGHASIWTAKVTSSVSMTVSVKRTNASGDPDTNGVWCKVYVFTGQHPTSPVPTVGENSSTTNNLTASLFTSAHANSYAIVSASEWNARPAPVSSDLTEDSFQVSGFMSGLSGYKSLGAAGAQTANLDAGGTNAASWNWVAIELREDSGAAEFSGTLLAGAADVDGTLSPLVAFSGALAAQASALAGIVAGTVAFSGALASAPATLTSSLGVRVDFSGALLSQASELAAQLLILGKLDTSNVRLNWTLGGRRLRIYMGPRR